MNSPRLILFALLCVTFLAGADAPAEGSRPRLGRKAASGTDAGVIKPTLRDTIRANVYADNWFALCVNGRLVAVDPIDFLPHNVVSVDLLPEYPMTIAVLAMDNADPRTGHEYGTSIGDGGFILKFSDGTVTNASWKARAFFRGPVAGPGGEKRVERQPLPARWYAVDFDDADWAPAVEYTVERVRPKEAFGQADFAGARFIWTGDLDLDNTVVFRTRIERPEWRPRWTTKPDLALPAEIVRPADAGKGG
jgi:hypothetical protein